SPTASKSLSSWPRGFWKKKWWRRTNCRKSFPRKSRAGPRRSPCLKDFVLSIGRIFQFHPVFYEASFSSLGDRRNPSPPGSFLGLFLGGKGESFSRSPGQPSRV